MDHIEITDDKSRLDIEITHGFLKRSHWASQRTRETLIKSIENSLCFGVYLKTENDDGVPRQIAFARVVTDSCTFAYLCDVFVDEEFRGRGISKKLMEEIMKHPDLQSYRRFTLATKDAHTLYTRYGFTDVEPGRFMEIKKDGI